MENKSNCLLSRSVPTYARGLHVLLVDRDTTSLMYAASVLEEHSYKVTTTELASVALSIAREWKGQFDLIMADVNLPDMNVLAFLRRVLLNKDIPVIMMSSTGDLDLAKKYLVEGACFFLEKPISKETLGGIWQHIFRTKRYLMDKIQILDCEGLSYHEKDSQERKIEELDAKSRITNGNNLHGTNPEHVANDPRGKEEQIEGAVNLVEGDHVQASQSTGTERYMITAEKEKRQGESSRKGSTFDKEGKREDEKTKSDSGKINSKDSKSTEEEGRERKYNDSGTSQKRSRMCWTPDLHRKFTAAICALGSRNKKPSPKAVLQIMNDPNLTHRQIASHLQKYKAQVMQLSAPHETKPSLVQPMITKSTLNSHGRTELPQSQEQRCLVNCLQRPGTAKSVNQANATRFIPSIPLASPGLYMINSVDYKLKTLNHQLGLAVSSSTSTEQPHSYYSDNCNGARMASNGEFCRLTHVGESHISPNGSQRNETGKENWAFVFEGSKVQIPKSEASKFGCAAPKIDFPFNSSGTYQIPGMLSDSQQALYLTPVLIAPTSLQNLNQLPITSTGLSQEMDIMPRPVFHGSALNQNRLSTGSTHGIQELDAAANQPSTENVDIMKVLEELENLEDSSDHSNAGAIDKYCEWLKEALPRKSSDLQQCTKFNAHELFF